MAPFDQSSPGRSKTLKEVCFLWGLRILEETSFFEDRRKAPNSFL
jgi:hypothetical protein